VKKPACNLLMASSDRYDRLKLKRLYQHSAIYYGIRVWKVLLILRTEIIKLHNYIHIILQTAL